MLIYKQNSSQRGKNASKYLGGYVLLLCFIINVQCTLDKCAVSFFSQVSDVLLQHHLRGEPHPD